MSRSKLREKVFQLLFRIAFGSEEEYEEQAALFFADEEQETLTEKEQKQIRDKYDQILAHLDKIDAQINEKSVGWNVSRLGKVELAIMRLAVYEILFDDTIPGSVSINEAVELAKKYGAQESPAFINGGTCQVCSQNRKFIRIFYFGNTPLDAHSRKEENCFVAALGARVLRCKTLKKQK